MRITISIILAAFLLIGIVAAQKPAEAVEKLVAGVVDGIDVVDACDIKNCERVGPNCKCYKGGCRCYITKVD